ncbi:MAG: 16S rRNA (adenine(1518)-N(6)/adenine(1519)-N(6))-dimethyltransferase RsmA [Pseudomonadota bacterium]
MTKPNIPTTSDSVRDHNLFARKSLGQHFLLDSNVTDKIVHASGNLSDINIIEIGAGPGGLTRSLLKSSAKNIYVVEKDFRFIPVLEELKRFYNERLTIIQDDALKVSLTDIVPEPRAIIANLPYNIGTELLFTWLDEVAINSNSYQFMTLMFQKEVAERIFSEKNTKQYGKLSVMTQFLCQVEYCFDLPAHAFTPPPKVESAVIKLTPHKKLPFNAEKQMLDKVVSAAFGNRRKMLRSSLKTITDKPQELLKQAGIDEERRAETLSLEEFCRLAEIYRIYVSKKIIFET